MQIRERRLDEVQLIKEDIPNPWTRYIGRADFNAADADEKWEIMRVTREGTIWTTTYALKGSRVAKWSLRTSYFPAVTVSYAAYQQSMGANFYSDTITLGGGDGVSYQLIWTGNDAADAAVLLESSVDGTCWCEVADSTFTIPLTAGCKPFDLTGMAMPFYRVKYTKGTNTTGLLDIAYNIAGYGKPWAVT
jgi:hypothetical protein